MKKTNELSIIIIIEEPLKSNKKKCQHSDNLVLVWHLGSFCCLFVFFLNTRNDCYSGPKTTHLFTVHFVVDLESLGPITWKLLGKNAIIFMINQFKVCVGAEVKQVFLLVVAFYTM